MNAQLPRDRSLLISIQIQKNLQISKETNTNVNKYRYRYKWSLLIQLDIYKRLIPSDTYHRNTWTMTRMTFKSELSTAFSPISSPHLTPPPFLAFSQSRACLIPSLQRVFAHLIPTSILRVCFCICAASCT